MRWIGLGILWRLACVHLTLTCKQKVSLLELSSSDWPQMALSLAYTVPACNWCAFGFLGLKGAFFFWLQSLIKCPNLWQALHWNFLAGHWKPSTWAESPHFGHLSLLWWAFLTSNHFLHWLCTWELSLPCCFYFDCLGFTEDFFFLYFPAGNSVHWCLRG